MKTTSRWAAAAVVLAMMGCATTGGGEMSSAEKKSLYDRLGGVEAIKAVVSDFIDRQAADPRLSRFYVKTDTKYLKGQISDMLCEVTGGPCKYTGMSMPDAHEGRDVGDADWNAMVENLVATLDHFKVPAQEKQELMGLLGPLKDQIVAKK
jgi:hemoglobin